MSWAVLIPIIAQYGLPLAESLYNKWASGNPPTEADWVELKAMSQQTAQDRMKSVLAAAGVPFDSEQGKQLIALAQ